MKKLLELHKAIKRQLKKIKEKADAAKTQELFVSNITDKDSNTNSNEKESVSTIVLDIKGTTVIKVVTLTILMIYFWSLFAQLTEIILVLLISIILSAAISPIINFLQKYKVPRSLSIVMLYVILLGIIFIILTSLIPLIAEQLSTLANFLISLLKEIQNEGVDAIPFIDYLVKYVDRDQLVITLENTLNMLANNIGEFTSNLLGSLTSFLSNVVSWGSYGLVALVSTFFMVVDEKGFEKFIISLVPKKNKKYFIEQGNEISLKLGAWLRGQLVLSFTIGLIAYIMLSIIGVEYAFTLAIITALIEFVPIVGPLVASVPATLLALSQSSTLGIVVLISYIALNTIESNIIAPIIMKKSVGLNPLAVIIAMLIGFKLMGPIGIFLAIPLASAVMVIVNDYASREK